MMTGLGWSRFLVVALLPRATSYQVSPPRVSLQQHPLEPVPGSGPWGHSWPSWHFAANVSAPDKIKFQLGLKENGTSDGKNLLVALLFNVVSIVAVLTLVSGLTRWCTLIFSYNVISGKVPFIPASHPLGWLTAGFRLTNEQVEDSAGLDAAMLLEFCNLGMKIAFVLGVPLCIIFSPIYGLLGGIEIGEAGATWHDWLAYMDMTNVEVKSWICWLVALTVWAVVITVESLIWRAQVEFIKRRTKWLQRMPEPRANTLLVTDIPPDCRSDGALKRYFERLFPGGAVESAYVAKRTQGLLERMYALRAAEQRLHEAEYQWQKSGGDESSRPVVMARGEPADAIAFYTEMLEQQRAKVQQEQERILKASDHINPKIYGTEGFVTFRTRRDAEVARQLQLETEGRLFRMAAAPAPDDVRYEDLLMEPSVRYSFQILGYACIAGLFFGFLPIVTALSSVTNLQTLKKIPLVRAIIRHTPFLESFIEGVLTSLALTIFMSFLPSIIRAIFLSFFSLKAEAWSQVHLQSWYFWFQVVFVVLITAVATSLLKSLQALVDSPKDFVFLLSQNLPHSSHFYMTYIVLQWTSNAVQALRLMPLVKFLMLRTICSEERARELAEPEDPDYYGMGARTARLALVLVIALVFCTMSPFILPLTCIFFFICRTIYGYLLVFAESKKADLGGVFWCQQLRQVQTCMAIYIVVMAGILSNKASTSWPCLIALSSLIYLWYYYYSFQQDLRWESISFRCLVESHGSEKLPPVEGSYRQPELQSCKVV